MPVYEFECDTCGPFEQRRDVSEASAPQQCPVCAATARRVFSLPNLRRMSDLQRKVMNRAERGVEPTLERRTPPEEPSATHKGHGGHDHHHHQRPWMIGH